MTIYHYDLYGWLTAVVIPDRSTEAKPPEETEGLRANWTGEAWVLREYLAPPPMPAPPAAPRLITVGAFFDRFGPLKWEILADPTVQVQAVIKDASVRQSIDLDRPDLPAGLALIADAGHDIDAEAVLVAPVQPHEAP